MPYETIKKLDLKDYVLAAMPGNGQYRADQIVKWATEIKNLVDEHNLKNTDPNTGYNEFNHI